MPVGVVAQWCVGEPTNVGRTGLRGERDGEATAHEYKAEDPPEMTKHKTSIGDDADVTLPCSVAAVVVIAAAILRHLHAVITTGRAWDPAIATHGTRTTTETPAAV